MICQAGLSLVKAIASSFCPRRGARQRGAVGEAEIHAARDHAIGRADAGQHDFRHLEILLVEEMGVLGDIERQEAEILGRQRDDRVLHLGARRRT
jgi:hypothetical protein